MIVGQYDFGSPENTMRIVTAEQAPTVRPQSHHREGSIEFQMYFAGAEESLGYYTMNIAGFESYYTPRHRHSYDQIRFCLSGSLNYGRNKEIPEGWIGYFPEGTHYGPQDIQCAWEDSPRVLTHQYGGASLQGFLTGQRLRPAYEALAESGRFEGGNYISVDSTGVERKQDGYEAAFEQATGAPLVYPEGRYSEPALLNPAAFRWRQTAESGVSEKVLGVFGECETRIAFVRLGAGATTSFGNRGADVTLFSMSGTMTIDGVDYPARTGVQVRAHETVTVSSAAGCEIYVVDLPDLSLIAEPSK
jgi:hypothetical protein